MVNQVRNNYAFIKYNTKDEYNYGKIYEVLINIIVFDFNYSSQLMGSILI
jgi:hypothetical protein